MTPLTELAEALPHLDPRIRTLDGSPVLILTFAHSETVEVMELPEQQHYYLIRTVKLTDGPRVLKHFLAITYGIALIPSLINEYVAGMTEMRNK